MRNQGYALLMALGISFFLMMLGTLSLQAAHTQSLTLQAESRVLSEQAQALGALEVARKLFSTAEMAQILAQEGRFANLASNHITGVLPMPDYLIAALEGRICALSLPDYPNVRFYLGWTNTSCNQELPTGLLANTGLYPPRLEGTYTQGQGYTYQLRLALLARSPKGRWSYAPWQLSVFVPQQTGGALGLSHAAVIERGSVELGSIQSIVGPAIFAGGLAIQGRPGLVGPVTIHGNNVSMGAATVPVNRLQPEPAAPCYQDACPNPSPGLSWRSNGLSASERGLLRGSSLAFRSQILGTPPASLNRAWPRLSDGSEVAEDAESLRLEALAPNDQRLTFTFPTSSVTLRYNPTTQKVRVESCQNCAGYTVEYDGAYIGHPDYAIKAIVGGSAPAISGPLFIYTRGNAHITGPLRPLIADCAKYQTTPLGAPSVVCRAQIPAQLLRIEAGPTGSLSVENTPIFAYLSAQKVTTSGNFTEIIGGVYAEELEGQVSIYHNPNYRTFSTGLGGAVGPYSSTIRSEKASPL
ncbi:MAG: hypothetical protein KatS3mg071_1640 [Meiothermus sp.]|nr:MAG: hypothetical protein KatS3mg071_1640 [Meiothermus sp.]